MRIRIFGRSFEIFTETSEHQIIVLAIVMIALLEIVNLFTTRYDTGLFEIVIATIAGLAGYRGGKAKARRKAKAKTKSSTPNLTPKL